MIHPSDPAAKEATSTAINKLIVDLGNIRAADRAKEVEAFNEAPNRANSIIMEVFKGLIASRRA